MATVLVTGGAGFIGSHLCDALIERGDSVVCLDNLLTGSKKNIAHLLRHPRFSFVRHDIIDPYVSRRRIDRIFNLACPASPVQYQINPIRTIKANTVGIINMLGLARKQGARILQASTSEIYGDPLEHPQKETYWGHVNPIGPRACYDEGKRCAETLFFDYFRAHKIKIKVARIFNTYGPRMAPDDGRVVSNFVIQAMQDKPFTLYGRGEQTRSFCYVDDMVEGLLRFMDSSARVIGPINFGNPSECTVKELAETIRRIAGSKNKIVHRPLPQDDPRQRRPDISLAKKLLNWEPTVSLDEGLEKTIEYFSEMRGA